ncbi:TonB-dependent receptor, partial [Stutzerimonas kirkiae]
SRPARPATPAAETTPESVSRLETVTVTARHGAEQAKEVPFGISVIDGETLESGRLQSLESALKNTPSVDLSSFGSTVNSNIRIRGIGPLFQVGNDDSSVGLNIDGVSLSSAHASLATLDVERLEVLKGPQGTLFGRNSSAGALNVVTRKPTRHTEGYLRGEVGGQGQHLQEAALGGELSEQLSGRIAIRNSGADHWIKIAESGKPYSKLKDLAFRSSLLWDLSPATAALFTAEYQHAKGLSSLMGVGFDGARPSDRIDVEPGFTDDNKRVIERYSAEISHDLAGSRLISVTSLVRTDNELINVNNRDVLRAAYGIDGTLLQHEWDDERVWSQDLRWQSLPDADLFWVAGVNYYQSERGADRREGFTGQPLAPRLSHDFETDSHALYGEITYPLGERLKITGGLRHTWDRKTYKGDYGTGQALDRRRLSDDYSTGRIALSYALTPATNLYTALARGYKSAGFSDDADSRDASAPYHAAITRSAEVGFKSELEQANLLINGALFHTKVDDEHLLAYDVLTRTSQTTNADVRSRGAELEGRWQPLGNLEVALSVSYIDAIITKDVYGVNGGDVDAGNRLADIPRWSGNLSLSHRQPLASLGDWSLNTYVNYRSVGKRPNDQQNHLDLGSYGKLDLRVGLGIGGAEIYLWGDNLLNDHYELYTYYYGPSLSIGAPSRGRSAGAGIQWHF